MKQFAIKPGLLKNPRKGLILSYFAKNIYLTSPLIAWYLSNGLVVTKVHQIITFSAERVFDSFVKKVTEARRTGDLHKDKALIGNMFKGIGNNAIGASYKQVLKFHDTYFARSADLSEYVNSPRFQALQEIGPDIYEISCKKTRIKFNQRLQLGFSVLCYAKLRMLQFLYDFLNKYIAPEDYEICSHDTDSFILSLSGCSIDHVVQPSLREAYFKERHLWLPAEYCDQHFEALRTFRLFSR